MTGNNQVLTAIAGGNNRYRHGGVQIMRDAYEMDNYRRDMGFLKILPNAAVIGRRHNMEVPRMH